MIAFAVALLCLPHATKASKPTDDEATLHVGISIWSDEYAGRGGLWTVFVSAFNGYGIKEGRGTFHAAISGAQALAGADTVIGTTPSPPHWALVMKRSGNGPVRVKISLRVDSKDPRTYDLCDHVLKAHFQPWNDKVDKVLLQENREVRAVAVRGGRRFRYGGQYLVAIDQDEKETPQQYDRRAEVASQSDIHCPQCGIKDSIEVSIVATVGSNGKVTWPRVRDNYGVPSPPTNLDPKLWAAIEHGLKGFRYRSALSAGRPVADYVTMTVRVVP